MSRPQALIVLERAVLVHELLDRADIPHAIGGALALGYHVGSARATDDIDINVTSDINHPEEVYRLLPPEIPWGDGEVRRVRERGNVRLSWPHPDGPPNEPIPLDLFFPEHEYHAVVASRTELVQMLDTTVPILRATDLMVFKMLFDRRKDWADIEELVRYGKADVAEAQRWVSEFVGDDDDRHRKLQEILDEVRASPTPPVPSGFFRRATSPSPAGLCGAETSAGTPCQNPASGCPHHG